MYSTSGCSKHRTWGIAQRVFHKRRAPEKGAATLLPPNETTFFVGQASLRPHGGVMKGRNRRGANNNVVCRQVRPSKKSG